MSGHGGTYPGPPSRNEPFPEYGNGNHHFQPQQYPANNNTFAPHGPVQNHGNAQIPPTPLNPTSESWVPSAAQQALNTVLQVCRLRLS